tara:strand:- start:6043 stop:7278 length:1236 start_codon:yes stop_codon:yes gene_type:complete
MINIKPFKGFVVSPDLVSLVSSPPYDTLSSREARIIVKNNSQSFLRVIKPEVDYESDRVPDKKQLHDKASENLENFIREGVLIKDQKPHFYIYQIHIGEHSQTGLYAAVSIRDYKNNLIKKHEHTRPDKEEDRVRNIYKTNANTGPVFLTFKNNNEFRNNLLNSMKLNPEIEFKSENGNFHRLWKISSNDLINRLIKYFHNVPALYIADGHHRAASAAKVQSIHEENNQLHKGDEAYNYFMAVIFPHDELRILGYNRVIKDLAGLNHSQFLELLEENFKIEKLNKRQLPKKPHYFTMFLKNRWYQLKTRRKIISDNAIFGLDVSVLQEYLLKPILKINDPRTDDRIDFVGGIRGLKELENRCGSGPSVAFALYPVTIQQLFKVSDQDEVMPPKSTWFEPKLQSGIVVRSLN